MTTQRRGLVVATLLALAVAGAGLPGCTFDPSGFGAPGGDGGGTDAVPTDALPSDGAATDAIPSDGAPTDAEPIDAGPTDCGDGELDPGEQCDDGNNSNEDACLNNCVMATCGDGFVWSGNEACDDGDVDNTNGCLNDCTVAVCGDGFVLAGVEGCDDDNLTDGDGCSSACAVEDYHACDGQPSVCSCVVYVNGLSTGTGLDGSSWADAYPSFLDGINQAGTFAASAGDYCDVWAAGGTYSSSTTYPFPSRVTVFGGFVGGETAVYQRDFRTNVTTLDGLGTADSVISGSSITEAGLDGVTVSGGLGSGWGGGVWVRGTDITFANCTFENNHANDDGGGIYITTDSSVTISRCIFRDNTASHNGGGLAVRRDAHVVVQDSLFVSNGAAGLGGAGWVETFTTMSSLTVINCTIVSNAGANGGGALRNDAGALTVVSSILWNNGLNEISSSGGSTAVTYSNVQGGSTGAGNTADIPLFVSSGQGNYQLQSTSPCIDSADGDQASARDLLGHGRVDALPSDTGIGTPTYVDRGAYEFGP
jgi:cysteine-rich repeat protein/parallel beta-helix repeat protein